MSVTCKNVVNTVSNGTGGTGEDDRTSSAEANGGGGAYSSPSDKRDDANCQREEKNNVHVSLINAKNNELRITVKLSDIK